jgi:hypothetical protein
MRQSLIALLLHRRAALSVALFALLLLVPGIVYVPNAHAWYVDFSYSGLPQGIHIENKTAYSIPEASGLFIQPYILRGAPYPTIGRNIVHSPLNPPFEYSFVSTFGYEHDYSISSRVSFKIVEDGNDSIIPMDSYTYAYAKSRIGTSHIGNTSGFLAEAYTSVTLETNFGLDLSTSSEYLGIRNERKEFIGDLNLLTNTLYTIDITLEEFADAWLAQNFPSHFSSHEELDAFINDYGESATLNISSYSEFGFNLYLDPADFSSVPVPAAIWLLGTGLAGLAFLKRRILQ